DLIAKRLQLLSEPRSIDRGGVLLTAKQFKRLQGSNLTILSLRHIHDDDVCMKLRRGITSFMIWPRRCVFELCGDHRAGRNCRLVSAATCLHKALELFKRFLDALSMGNSHSFVIANKCYQRNRFRSAKGRVPPGAMLTCRNFFTEVVDGFP